jgi:hypothetical protein
MPNVSHVQPGGCLRIPNWDALATISSPASVLFLWVTM